MGIKNLHKLLQKYVPGCYEPHHLSNFAYQRVAIDISLYLYKYKAIGGDKWLESFLYLVSSLRKWNIHCVFIYDNKAPIEKSEEQQRRRETRAKQYERVTELEEDIKKYEQTGAISENMKDICKKEGVTTSLLRKSKESIDIKVIKRKLESMKSMIISITEEDLQLTRDLFDLLQIPYIKAPSEAEAYSSYLCIHGKVDAVLSEDTDVLAYGAPLFLTKIDTFNETVVSIHHESLLQEIEMEKTTFLDLCIMLGCDYNTNIPRIGLEKSYALIKQYRNIDEMTDINSEDKKVLNHTRCRELFAIPDKMDVYVPYCGIPNFAKVKTFLATHGLRVNMEIFEKNTGESELSFIE